MYSTKKHLPKLAGKKSFNLTDEFLFEIEFNQIKAIIENIASASTINISTIIKYNHKTALCNAFGNSKFKRINIYEDFNEIL